MNDIQSIKEIISNVDWLDEPHMTVVLLTLYLYCALMTYITWEHVNFQTLHFVTLCFGIYGAEPLNEYLALNWTHFPFKKQYFDSSGMFISIVYSLPLLMNLVGLLLRWLSIAARDLVLVKRLQIKEELKKENKKVN